jgi:ankyrin repeat protein
MRVLLESGAGISLGKSSIQTVPNWKFESFGPVQKNEALSKALLNNGVNINESNFGEGSALYIAARCDHENHVRILLECGADIDLADSGYAPIHIASIIGGVNALRILVGNGADINTKTCMGGTPLHCAVEWASLECVRILLEVSGIEINPRNNHGRTPMDNLDIRIRKFESGVRGSRVSMGELQQVRTLLQEKGGVTADELRKSSQPEPTGES